jgi:hypothetical protein
LDEISSDSLGALLSYLDIRAVIRLYECGNLVLNSKIRQSYLDGRIEGSPLMSFPFSVFNLFKPRSLAILCNTHASLYPLRLNGAIPLPTAPVSSVSSLTFSFGQSFRVLQLEGGIPLLDRYFPNLKSLHLECSIIFLTQNLMKAVPKGLEELRLISRYSTSDTPPMPIAALLDLPPMLRSLHIRSAPIMRDAECADFSGVFWPSQLTLLHLETVDRCIFAHLPHNLEALTLFLERAQNLSIDPKQPGVFPNSLTHLEIHEFGTPEHARLKFRPDLLPPNLKVCEVDLDYSAPLSNWHMVPQSITTITLESRILSIGAIPDFFPKLANLEFRINDSQLDIRSLLTHPPAQLKEVYCPEACLSEMCLPQNLKYLFCRVAPLDLASTTDSLRLGTMSHLPRRLISLDFSCVPRNYLFRRDDFERLPKTLESIEFKLRNLFDREALLGIPSILKSILLELPSSRSHALNKDPDLPDLLPSGLTSIRLSTVCLDTAWRRWMLRLNRFKALSSISILSIGDEEEGEPISLDFIESLPKSLMSLHFPIDGAQIVPEQLAALPKHLTRLTFTLDSGHSAKASDACMASLPKTLSYLSLPDRLEGLSQNVVPFLPPSLTRLRLPKPINEAKKLYFLQEPEWLGYEP